MNSTLTVSVYFQTVMIIHFLTASPFVPTELDVVHKESIKHVFNIFYPNERGNQNHLHQPLGGMQNS
jgi:hypothetical protein